MWSFFNLADLPQTDLSKLEWIWLQHLDAARAGSDEDATMVLGLLSWCLQENCATPRMREWLSDALISIADASPGKQRERTTKEVFLLGRRAGSRSPYQALALEQKRGRWLWLELGDLPDDQVNEQVAALLARVDPEAPDPRPYAKAYRRFRDEVRKLEARQANKPQ